MLAREKIGDTSIGACQLRNGVRRWCAAASFELCGIDIVTQRRGYNVVCHSVRAVQGCAIKPAEFHESGFRDAALTAQAFPRRVAQAIDVATTGLLFVHRQACGKLLVIPEECLSKADPKSH